MKQCSKCHVWKDEIEFYRDKRTKDGLKCQCKKCHCKTTVATRDENKLCPFCGGKEEIRLGYVKYFEFVFGECSNCSTIVFDCEPFTDYYPVVVSKERYTEQEAIEIAKRELMVDEVEKCDGYVDYGYGVDDEDISAGARNMWWLVWSKPKRGCPVWAFRPIRRADNG